MRAVSAGQNCVVRDMVRDTVFFGPDANGRAPGTVCRLVPAAATGSTLRCRSQSWSVGGGRPVLSTEGGSGRLLRRQSSSAGRPPSEDETSRQRGRSPPRALRLRGSRRPGDPFRDFAEAESKFRGGRFTPEQPSGQGAAAPTLFEEAAVRFVAVVRGVEADTTLQARARFARQERSPRRLQRASGARYRGSPRRTA